MKSYVDVFRLSLNINLSLYCHQIIPVLFMNMIISINMFYRDFLFYKLVSKLKNFVLRLSIAR